MSKWVIEIEPDGDRWFFDIERHDGDGQGFAANGGALTFEVCVDEMVKTLRLSAGLPIDTIDQSGGRDGQEPSE